MARVGAPGRRARLEPNSCELVGLEADIVQIERRETGDAQVLHRVAHLRRSRQRRTRTAWQGVNRCRSSGAVVVYRIG